MKLKFFDTSLALDARVACHSEEGGIIVTSHEGCNKAGERGIYKVSSVSAVDDG